MCDVCCSLLELFERYDAENVHGRRSPLPKSDVLVLCTYVQAWNQRQCTCCYKDAQSFDKFNAVIQGLLETVLVLLRQLRPCLSGPERPEEESVLPDNQDAKQAAALDGWSLEDQEKLLHFASKVFLLNFPLYVAFKHSLHSKLEEVSPAEVAALSTVCDVNDLDIPVHLLRNVTYFCGQGGLAMLQGCFNDVPPQRLPIGLAHALVSLVSNLKLWMNLPCIVQHLVPLRSSVIKYLCSRCEGELRGPASRSLFELMLGAVKDPLDVHLALDREGLELAFKCFVSPTLTMRLSGIAQINSHISMLNELCHSESVGGAQTMARALATWLVEYQIVERIFGPNLHVEVIKQSHLILGLLASENLLTTAHLDTVWAASQLKHCGRQVLELLPPLIRNLRTRPARHLYGRLCAMPPREHSEQTLLLASALTKHMWASSGKALRGGRVSPFGPLTAAKSHAVRSHKAAKKARNDGTDASDEEEDEEDDEHPVSGSKGPVLGEAEALQVAVESSSDSQGSSPAHHPQVPVPGMAALQPWVAGQLASEPREDEEESGMSAGEEEEEEEETEEELSTDDERLVPSRPPILEAALVGKRSAGGLVVPPRDTSSPDGGGSSHSNAASNQSEKNLADFDGELLDHHPMWPSSAAGHHHHHQGEHQHQPGSNGGVGVEVPPSSSMRDVAAPMSPIDVGNVCQPGQTLLWDLLQDGKIEELGEELSLEAEKILCSLVCWSVDRSVRTQFIKGCLANLSKSKSVVVSLRLLPKLLASFQQPREGADPHTVTLWAEKDHHMMQLFLDDLVRYTSNRKKPGGTPAHKLYTHREQIQVRLHFLSCIFSAAGSPDSFVLSREQVDVLWSCLALDPECGDELFSWLLSQVRNKEQHALSPDLLRYLLLEKLPQLPASSTSMTALHLLQQLSGSSRVAAVSSASLEAFSPSPSMASRVAAVGGSSSSSSSSSSQLEQDQSVSSSPQLASGIDQLWEIALRASSTDVSMAAIQYLNSFYLHAHQGTLEREEEFAQRCMHSLRTAKDDLAQRPQEAEECTLTVVQRALQLLKLHLETFQRRYAFHLRRWQLREGVLGLSPHGAALQDPRGAGNRPLRVVCQPAGLSHKTTLELQSWDLVGDLRAEVAHWWEGLQPQQLAPTTSPQQQQQQHGAMNGGEGGTGAGAGGGAGAAAFLRMISQGQELTTDLDEKPLAEVGFKDLQLVFVSVGAARQRRRAGTGLPEPASLLPCPPRERLPTLILLRAAYLDCLFPLMHLLGNVRTRNRQGEVVLHTKAQVLSRRVWEILAMLPTSPAKMRQFIEVAEEPEGATATLQKLLNPDEPQKLMYSLQIVESLRQRGSRSHFSQAKDKKEADDLLPQNNGPCCSTTNDIGAEVKDMGYSISSGQTWADKFVACGGLRHLFDIFISGALHPHENEEWNEWAEDCLACLLRVLYQLGVEGGGMDLSPENSQESLSSDSSLEQPRKKTKLQRRCSPDRLFVPRLGPVLLQMLTGKESICLSRLLQGALGEGAQSRDPHELRTGFWGRPQVVQCAMRLLASWAHSRPPPPGPPLLLQPPQGQGLDNWLRRLVLDDPDPAVRREACTGLYRLCLGVDADGRGGQAYINPVLASLLDFLSAAQSMQPLRQDEGEKEPYGPGCRDYFFLVCQLVDNLDDETPADQKVDLNALAVRVAEAILTRDVREMTLQGAQEDDGLYGLLALATAVAKHNPPFKFSKQGQEFSVGIMGCLFSVSNPGGQWRQLPKCRSAGVRAAAYDLLLEMVRGCEENFGLVHAGLLQQHRPKSHSPYPWDYWPHEDGRSECGYVGLTNLGATCYLASCMQHLFMLPQARASILSAQTIAEGKHCQTLRELQRMFAYLLESERKAYNPRSFCKAYTMDHQPLNTGEQKDMVEFFTDLISKLEEMTPQLKEVVKRLFCGVLSNNVVSLDCNHISRTLEEFYTLRCQVADMRNLYESMDELTVKDTLEGDNMYTCSQCGKKVRAEKRACVQRLPHILCFNTMRYTFNMVTMMKEKVNTHFSFPLRLDMSNYMESNLLPSQARQDNSEAKSEEEDPGSYEYDLIGVTVHTGTADGGHYYSFIRERQSPGKDKWFLFNDAEVKPFDPSHIAAECFGGEMTSKTYDSVTDKFMDFSFEKTNSAYMLFYERCPPDQPDSNKAVAQTASEKPAEATQEAKPEMTLRLPSELAEWIWQDNMQFLQDKSLFDHTYFNFLYQMCGSIPQTLPRTDEATLLAAELGTSFVLETLIHAKEKPTMAQWIELLTKQFNASQAACEWFLDHMAEDECWPVQILIRCPNQVVRQLFQRLCIHVINQLQPGHSALYLQPYPDSDDSSDVDLSQIGQYSCVTRFVRKLLALARPHGAVVSSQFSKPLVIEHGAKQHLRHLTEYFAFLLEFAKMGEEECQFLLSIEAISSIVSFYLSHKLDYVEMVSEEEDEEEEEEGGGTGGGGLSSSVSSKCRPASLDKMVCLVLLLVEKSRADDHRLQLAQADYNALTGGKGFPFLYHQIRDNICLRQTCNLILSLCRWNETLAPHIVNMIFSSVTKQPEASGPFFKLLSMLVEYSGGPSGMPPFTSLVLQRVWEAAEYCPLQTLEWLTMQVPRNKLAHSWVLQSMDVWVEKFLIAHALQRVRNVAALLLVSLVPSSQFRQAFRSGRNGLAPQKDLPMSPEAVSVMHQVFQFLLRLLKKAKMYIDPAVHGTAKLMYYFAVLTYCLVGKQEKLMFSQFFLDLWSLFQPGLSEPAIPVHHNKQTLLLFWYQACVDCPENVKLIVQNPHVTKNIAFNYILADHDDQDVVVFNRCMLPAYYGLLRLCCQQSRAFARQLAAHQNVQWAFKNITPYTTLYTAAVGELLKLMELFVSLPRGASEQEQREVSLFKRTTLALYLSLDPRVCWATLVAALRILVGGPQDRLLALSAGGLPVLFQALHTLHVMYHEATACHVTGDLGDLLSLLLELLRTCAGGAAPEPLAALRGWPQLGEGLRRLLTLLNSYVPPQVRLLCLEVLKELVTLLPRETVGPIVPLLASCHSSFLESNGLMTTGPYFPRRGQKSYPTKTTVRPQRPMLQMFLHLSQLEAVKGVDPEYDQALLDFFLPYHQFVETLFRAALSQNLVSQDLVNLSAMVSIEGVPLHIDLIPRLWLEVLQGEKCAEFGEFLRNSTYVTNCVSAVLLEERGYLNNPMVFRLFSLLVPKVGKQVLKESVTSLILTRANALVTLDVAQHMHRITADLRAVLLVLSVHEGNVPACLGLVGYLRTLENHCKDALSRCEKEAEKPDDDADSPPAKKARNPPEDGDKPTGPRSPVEPPPPSTSSSCEGELMRPLLETVQALLRALTQGERPAASS
ncbi:ubiquitinyl hydrolase 1 puf isoform X3 [Haemaphysalis longicornis]